MTRTSALRSAASRLAALAVASLLLTGCGADEGPQWGLLWSDEFDGPAGQLPDASKWQFDIGTDWGNAQLEYDTDRPENASLDGNGNLVITARQEPYMGSQYTSARVTTAGLFEQARGRFEARLRLPSGQGLWPAFWMLGADFPSVGWPASGEIDIMEYRGQEPSIVFGSLHGPGYSGGDAVTRRFQLIQDRFDTGFHVFAVEWTEDYIDWSVDGQPYQRVTPGDVTGPWVFDKPFYLILNVAVGGTIVGPPGPNTTFPQTMLVDYVRVYGDVP